MDMREIRRREGQKHSARWNYLTGGRGGGMSGQLEREGVALAPHPVFLRALLEN